MSTAATPAHAGEDEFFSSDAVTDSELGHDILFGMIVGTPLTYLVVVVMCLIAGTGTANAFGIALLPCVLSGVFFGGIVPLSRQMGRHERAEVAARKAIRPAVPLVVPVAPAPAV